MFDEKSRWGKATELTALTAPQPQNHSTSPYRPGWFPTTSPSRPTRRPGTPPSDYHVVGQMDEWPLGEESYQSIYLFSAEDKFLRSKKPKITKDHNGNFTVTFSHKEDAQAFAEQVNAKWQSFSMSQSRQIVAHRKTVDIPADDAEGFRSMSMFDMQELWEEYEKNNPTCLGCFRFRR